MVQVVWTRRALADVEAIRAYISRHSPIAAQRMALRLLNAGNALDQYPERGRSIGGSRRELTTVPPYLLRYRIKGDVVEMLTVRHGAQAPE